MNVNQSWLNLTVTLSTSVVPVHGFGMGDVVLADLLTEKKLVPKLQINIDAFVLIEDESLRDQSLFLVQQLRDAGLVTEYPLVPTKSDKQFKRALELNSRFTLRVQLKDGREVASVKNLASQQQTEMAPGEVSGFLAAQL